MRPFTRPWMLSILIDLSDEQRPEWCEVCADFDCFDARVPARAVANVDGIACCPDCVKWARANVDGARVRDLTAPTVVQSFETMAAVVAGALS